MNEAQSMTLSNPLADGFARTVGQVSQSLGASPLAVELAARVARMTSVALQAGHTCIEAADWLPPAMPLESGVALLISSEVVARAPLPVARPLVVDGAGRVYLHRYFDFERRLALAVARRTNFGTPPAPAAAPADDAQARAVELVLAGRWALVSGGPGTGKTTTVARMLEGMLRQSPGMRVALAAPTGKAAARMMQALRARTADWPPTLREALPAQAHTVHRLLGVTPDPGRFRHSAENPLPLDLLVVDEASMLDLALATRLLEALPGHARVVWLGDRDQLSAVESGAVFAELSAADSPSAGACARLTRNFRFSAESGLGELAEAIRVGAEGRSWERVSALTPADVEAYWQDGYRPFLEAVQAVRGASPVDSRHAQAVHAAFGRFRILCGLREGPYGVVSLQNAVEGWLRRGLGVGGAGWYAGRAVMVTQNDARLGLFNGDVGIALPGERGELNVVFEGNEGPRRVPVALLPAHESALAMTVHKAQGSEFDRVLLVMGERDSPVFSREWVYTGVTRARSELRVLASESLWAAALARKTRRRSGLQARLREAVAATATDPGRITPA